MGHHARTRARDEGLGGRLVGSGRAGRLERRLRLRRVRNSRRRLEGVGGGGPSGDVVVGFVVLLVVVPHSHRDVGGRVRGGGGMLLLVVLVVVVVGGSHHPRHHHRAAAGEGDGVVVRVRVRDRRLLTVDRRRRPRQGVWERHHRLLSPPEWRRQTCRVGLEHQRR